MKKKYNLTIYLAYIFLFPLFIFGYFAKLYDKYISKNKNNKKFKHIPENRKEDLEI